LKKTVPPPPWRENRAETGEREKRKERKLDVLCDEDEEWC